MQDSIVSNTAPSSEEVTRLRREHADLEARLDALNGRLYLSAEEELERRRLQKLKLLKKDRLLSLGHG